MGGGSPRLFRTYWISRRLALETVALFLGMVSLSTPSVSVRTPSRSARKSPAAGSAAAETNTNTAAAQKPPHDPKFGYGMPAFAEDTALGPAQPLGEMTVKISAATCTYSGKTQKPQPAVTYDGLKTSAFETKRLTNGRSIGSHKFRITLKGCFTNAPSAAISYKIIPARPTITKVTITKPRSKYKPGKASVTWSKGEKYYQFQLSRMTSFSSKQTWNKKKRTKLLEGLKRGKNYYVRVRTGASVGGEMYWSAWSKTRKIKIK